MSFQTRCKKLEAGCLTDKIFCEIFHVIKYSSKTSMATENLNNTCPGIYLSVTQ